MCACVCVYIYDEKPGERQTKDQGENRCETLKGSAGCTMMFKLYLEDVLCNTWRSFSKEVKVDFPFSCSMEERLEEGHDQR